MADKIQLTDDDLEAVAVRWAMGNETADIGYLFRASTAISLKRIADRMDADYLARLTETGKSYSA